MTSTSTEGTVGYAALWVADLDRATEFFANALGWSYADASSQHRMLDDPAPPPRSIVALAVLPRGVWDRWPRHNTLFLSHSVEDVTGAVQRVRDAGGRASEPTDSSRRGADCVDDQGMPFSIHENATVAHQLDAHPGHGQLAYLTFEVADSAVARAFYAAVFGWGFGPGNVEDGWQIEGLRPMAGLHGGHAQSTVVPMYAVHEIAAAVARVREAGGTATDPQDRSFGAMSSCTDDQGTGFHLGELRQP